MREERFVSFVNFVSFVYHRFQASRSRSNRAQRTRPTVAGVFATLLLAAGSARSQTNGPQLAPPLFAGLIWRNLGPALYGGRIIDIDVARIPGRADQIYVLPENGGVYKSSDNGVSWTQVFGNENTMMSMGDIAVAPSSPNTVWLGTGSGLNPSYYWGEGVYKSTDGGQTWTNMGLRETRHIGRIVVHPTNPNIVFVAAAGRLWGPSTERGLFRTTDGGATWTKVLGGDPLTGASDVVVNPHDPRVVYATLYQRLRNGFGGNGVGPGSGIYKSTDGGGTWTKLTHGLPTEDLGRIGLTISPVDPNLVYADVEVGGAVYSAPAGAEGDCPPASVSSNAVRGQFETGNGGIYRTTDGGATWEHVFSRSDQPVSSFVQIRADPKDRNRVYREGTGFYVSDDMGHTFRSINTNLHGDYRSLWVDPDDNQHLIIGNDGGLALSWSRGATWDYRNTLPIGEYWELSVDHRDPYYVCGGLQDNGIWCVPSAVRDRNGISRRDAFSVGGGDGMFFQIDPRDTNYAFIEVNSASTDNSIQRLDLATLQRQSARPGMMRPVSCLDAQHGVTLGRAFAKDPSYRWAWNTPIVFSTVTPGVVYAGANVLFRSTDRGGSWKVISPDLTSRIDRDTVRIMGKPVGKVNYSPGGGPAANPLLSPLFGAITWIGESPLDGHVLYTGTDDGQVQVTRDGGATWTNVTSNIPELPPHTFVTSVQPSRFAAGRVYATFDGHFNNDERAYVYVSDDFGKHWRAITNGLPSTAVTRIAEHPRSANLLVVGHSRGVHFSNDGGATWHSLSTNMPTVPVRSVVFQERDNSLVVGTYGRGVWVLDDVGPLETLTPDAIKSLALLASVTRGRQWHRFSLGPTYGAGEFYAPNPEFDPVISYYVRDAATGPAAIVISDAKGQRVRTLSGPAAAGLDRVTWDMRYTSATEGKAAGGRRGRGGRGGGRGGTDASPDAGPLVLPGTYAFAVTVPGVDHPLRGEIHVEGDPMDHTFTSTQRLARQDALMRLYRLQKDLVDARAGMEPGSGVTSAGTTLDAARIGAELDRLIGITGTLMRAIESFSSVPTADQRQQMDWAAADAARALALVNRPSRFAP